MRPLKFRQPIFNDKGVFTQFHYWGYVNSQFEGEFVSPAGFIFQVVKKSESYQFTGLKDKNGREIYEGDIVRDSEETFEVYFGEISFEEYEGIGWILKMLPENDDTNFWLSPDDTITLEIIGNIFEHPELIK
jgi:uncharacterized phage protein (TIGR01671 family)